MKLKRRAPGSYTAQYAGTLHDYEVEIEYRTPPDGDAGWFALVDFQQITDWPRQTRRAATAVAERYIAQVEALVSPHPTTGE